MHVSKSMKLPYKSWNIQLSKDYFHFFVACLQCRWISFIRYQNTVPFLGQTFLIKWNYKISGLFSFRLLRVNKAFKFVEINKEGGQMKKKKQNFVYFYCIFIWVKPLRNKCLFSIIAISWLKLNLTLNLSKHCRHHRWSSKHRCITTFKTCKFFWAISVAFHWVQTLPFGGIVMGKK